jgi:hypothetical protein
MKHLLSLLLATAISAVVLGQNARFTEIMQKNIAALDSTRTVEGFQTMANNFERIANAEKTEWLPAYYAAYALIMKAYYIQDIKEVDAVCDKADAMIAISESLQSGNSEITTLKAMVLSARMRVDMSRGMTMGPKSAMLLKEALEQKPANNPRALVQMAQNLYYTPAAFGGGKEPGMETLKKGIAAYGEFQPASAIDPNWGKGYAERLMKRWEESKSPNP